MAFYHIPAIDIHKTFTKLGLIKDIYDAMKQDDWSHIAVIMLDNLKSSGKIPIIPEMPKCQDKSATFRSFGNQCFVKKEFKSALVLYNKALLYAPFNSEAMKLAYSNRSALLLQVEAYSACLTDIQTCVSLKCSPEIVKKLKKRKESCEQSLHKEQFKIQLYLNEFTERFFKLDTKRNPNVPCATIDVKVIVENNLPRVVAAHQINVGTVVAIEDPFVSYLEQNNYYLACYYCHKISLNLMPCRGCVYAMFCNENCEMQCKNEYHDVECKIMNFLENSYINHLPRLTIKCTLKLRQKCKNWKEFIAASYNMGLESMKNSSVSENYNRDNKSSILNFDNEICFVDGQLFNASIFCALAMYHLQNVPSFFPHSRDERVQAIQAVGRIMMYLYVLFPNRICIENSAIRIPNNDLTTNTEGNYGWFSFTSKLSHACDANLLVVGIHNKVALIAFHPIKKGTELKISYIGHWYEFMYSRTIRQYNLYKFLQRTCNCTICLIKWDRQQGKEELTLQQKRTYRQWLSISNKLLLNRDKAFFEATCKALAELYTATNSDAHLEMFREFRNLISLFQWVATYNYILD